MTEYLKYPLYFDLDPSGYDGPPYDIEMIAGGTRSFQMVPEKPTLSRKWASRFYTLAELIATWSKDPDRQVGAVIVSDRKIVRGMGYNGIPRGLEDVKLRTDDHIHAEVNAILNASGNVKGCALFVTTFPCTPCAAVIIQAGIEAVYAPSMDYGSSSWWHSQLHAMSMFHEAGVEVANAK